jgi:hypothetical protein
VEISPVKVLGTNRNSNIRSETPEMASLTQGAGGSLIFGCQGQLRGYRYEGNSTTTQKPMEAKPKKKR